MPPKAKKGGNAQKQRGGAEEEREERLVAVVFADSFETTFAPFTLEKPRCLLPLANTPLIEYTLEFLAGAGVQDVILYCGNHTDQVDEYLQRSKWTSNTSPFSLDLMRSQARSIGDAMRELDAQKVIEGDFICVYGDVVANVPLETALNAHRARRDKNKKAIMTMVLREAADRHRQKLQSMRPAFVIDPATQRCVHYEQIRRRHTSRLDIPEEVLKECVEVDVREDLIDCGIDICNAEVLAQYTDNFDWQLPRRGFLRGMLKDYETLQLMVHTHVVKEGYAARVKNLQTYDQISRDVVARWAYPLCPDVNLLAHQSYQFGKGNVYKEDGVVLARSTKIGRNTVLGKATSVGAGSSIDNSVIGRRCVIGKRVVISGAYIWDDVVIGDGTIIDRAIVADKTEIWKAGHLLPGSMVSYGVVLAEGTRVESTSRVTKVKRRQSQSLGSSEKATSDPKMVGEGGEGHNLDVDDEDDELLESMVPSLGPSDDTALSDASISDIDSDDEEASLDSDAKRRSSRSESFASINSDESGHTRRKAADFHHEAVNSMVDSMANGQDADSLQLELQALRLSSNAEDKQIRRAVAVTLTKRIASLVESGTSPASAVENVIPPYKLLVQRCVRTGTEDYSEQADFLLYMQTDLAHRKLGSKILLFAGIALNKQDLVEAEGFEEWWEDKRSKASDELEKVRGETEQLVETLVGEEDDSEEDEESE